MFGRELWRDLLAERRECSLPEILGDPSDPAEVLELSVKTVSRYLDKNNVPLHSANRGVISSASASTIPPPSA